MLRKKKKAILIGLNVILIICVLGFMQSTEAAVCRTDIPTGTTVISSLYGTAAVNGQPVQVGDEIRAYVASVEVNAGCIGRFVVTSQGDYGLMSIYGDDVTTTVKDGAADGDTIHLVICRNGYEYEFDQTQVWTSAIVNDIVELNLTCTNCCTNFYRDHDGDGSGLTSDMQCLMAPDAEYTVTVGGDCDDNNQLVYDGTACDDGDPCTHTDTCSGGACVGTAYTCDDSNVCTDNVCLGDGTCDYPANTGSCDDGDPCTHTDTCATGVCAGTAYTCDDSNVCTDNVCLGDGTCDYPANTASCDDADACTHTDTCSGGACVGTAYTCDDNNGCTDNVCLGDGTCDYPAVSDGTSCDDGDACTHTDICTSGACAGTAYTCDDSNVCTDDVCLGDGTCDYPANTASCDDGNECTVGDACSGGICVGGAPKDCDDNDPCTVDTCDPNSGCENLFGIVNVLTATGQEYIGVTQTAEVSFGVDSVSEVPDPNNWSADFIVRLQLIDSDADPNNIVDSDLLIEDIRPAPSSDQTIAWSVMVEIGADANSSLPDYYPELSWDISLCPEVDGRECTYKLIRGLDSSGDVLVPDMAEQVYYDTNSQDGDPVQYFTILMKCPEPIPPVRKPTGQIFPWPGVYPGGLGWGGIPFSAGFPGGLPYPMRSGYAPGLSIPSFPGTYTGFTYPGSYSPWTSYAWTSYVPRFPVTFPALGIFSPIGWQSGGWPINYWTGGYPKSYTYQTGWFYTYR